MIYRSKIVENGGHDAVMEHIKQILGWSRNWNPKNGITGALMLDEGGFAQVLEGPPHTVKSLFGHIAVDKRHKAVEIMEADFHRERDFGSWSMAFIGKDGAADIALAGAPKVARPVKGDTATSVISLLRWFLKEQT